MWLVLQFTWLNQLIWKQLLLHLTIKGILAISFVKQVVELHFVCMCNQVLVFLLLVQHVFTIIHFIFCFLLFSITNYFHKFKSSHPLIFSLEKTNNKFEFISLGITIQIASSQHRVKLIFNRRAYKLR